MRDEFGEIDPDELDIIEADPGDSGPAPRPDDPGQGDGAAAPGTGTLAIGGGAGCAGGSAPMPP